MVPEGSWVNAPKDHIIAGLKELPDDGSFLPHTHIQFGHCYKQQSGSAEYLSRFVKGGGMLYDIEFLTNENGRRVAAFGYWAGYAGAAIALMAWSHQLLHPGTPQPPLPLYESADALVADVKTSISKASTIYSGQLPQVIVMSGVESILKWDMAETARGGPFPEIPASDIFINCDPNNPHNPVPVYSDYSTFQNPSIPIPVADDGPELRVVCIDHLPSLVAREASNEFSSLLLPSLLTLNNREREGVWARAERVYQDKAKELL